MTTSTRRLIVIAGTNREAHDYVRDEHPDLVGTEYWQTVRTVYDLSGRSRERYGYVTVGSYATRPDWPAIASTLRLLRLPQWRSVVVE